MDGTAPNSNNTSRQDELAGKTAIVTGSTSGIGLGIARAFASAGMNVILNGFGDPQEIERIRRTFESEFHVTAAYSPRTCPDLMRSAPWLRMRAESAAASMSW